MMSFDTIAVIKFSFILGIYTFTMFAFFLTKNRKNDRNQGDSIYNWEKMSARPTA